MLVLSRKVGERILIGDEVVMKVLAVEGQRIRLGFEAPESVLIRREELCFDPIEVKCRARPNACRLPAPQVLRPV